MKTFWWVLECSAEPSVYKIQGRERSALSRRRREGAMWNKAMIHCSECLRAGVEVQSRFCGC
eukprot:1253857-Amphidinium_carterae.1